MVSTHSTEIRPSLDEPDSPAQRPHELAYRINWKVCHVSRTQKILRRFMAETAASCHALESTFWSINADGKRVEGTINSGKDFEKVEKLVVHAHDSVVGLIATTGISACIGPGEFKNMEITNEFHVRNMVVAPVTIDSQICGVVSAINYQDGEKFRSEELETLQWRAYLLGLVLVDVLKEDDY